MEEAKPDPKAEATAEALAEKLAAGDRRALARGVTLIESTRADHRRAAAALVRRLHALPRKTLRLGLSGTPGVGKSTFIEAFGLKLAEEGHKLAVLAVDPSSARTGGSILGDKTRMEQLSRHPNAFIRPSPSGAALGGVARRTREAILLCEAAGFDLVMVETVGVGQSETMVAEMTDIFLLLMAPAGGDELQGVKRGIMEICDMILVNKADGDLKATAERTRADYASALRLLRGRPHDPNGFPKATAVSAVSGAGLEAAWEEISALAEWRRETGVLEERRREQAVSWFRAEVEEALLRRFRRHPAVAELWPRLEATVADGATPPQLAAARALAAFGLGEED
ncbi:methylmalonyl Co-A mutase-associated GTPase MeaB [Albimonas sp. CAU 1670]|uniref:methylmalonyl Co-A mutase-associated GTPase MeaB n=1 Tax=Albimonas sp. CAU 1670 TaxID=3032599 RepID=UPI0023DBD8C4|nr:methylmalonyl Co-A mutase-associated GTPase MeaB [Albimonas sp. CAU 1670]MDF2233234.1 methylmalonyl Co-A mutase-associated GTPase MeaB [Albimonas sp. CAU 1670]